jgi:hypothetical protein
MTAIGTRPGRVADFRGQAQRIRSELAQRGMGEDAIGIAVAPQETMAVHIAWEVALYERLKAGGSDSSSA